MASTSIDSHNFSAVARIARFLKLACLELPGLKLLAHRLSLPKPAAFGAFYRLWNKYVHVAKKVSVQA